MTPQYRRAKAARAFERNIEWCTKNHGLIPDEGFAPVLEFLHWLLEECGPGTVATLGYARQLVAFEKILAHRNAKGRSPQPPVTARPRLRLVK